MEDFYKEIRENLENRPEPQFQESSWQKMQTKLNPEKKPRLIIPFWVWLAIPLLALLGTNIWSFQKWQQLTEKIDSFHTTRDTVYLTKNIYAVDTIYLIKQVEEISYVKSETAGRKLNQQRYADMSFLNKLQNFDFSFTGIADQNLNMDRPYLNGISLGTYTNKTNQNSKTFIEDILMGKEIGQQHSQLTTKDKLSGIPLMPSLATSSVLSNNFAFVDVASTAKREASKKSFRKRIYELGQSFRPRSFQLGAFAGGAYPLKSGIENQGGYSFSLQAEIGFANGLAMWINASYLNLIYDSNRMDESIGIPVEESPNQEFIFETASVESPSFQYSVGMQYYFNRDKKWKPLVGIGYGTITLLTYDVTYEFGKQNNTNGEPKYTKDVEINPQKILPGFLMFRAGFEYEISTHFNLNILGGYRRDMTKNIFSSPSMLSLRTGVSYKF